MSVTSSMELIKINDDEEEKKIQEIIKELCNSKQMPLKEDVTKFRQTVVKLVGSYLMIKYEIFVFIQIALLLFNFRNHYPKMDVKIKFAKAIINLYPFIGDGSKDAYVKLRIFHGQTY